MERIDSLNQVVATQAVVEEGYSTRESVAAHAMRCVVPGSVTRADAESSQADNAAPFVVEIVYLTAELSDTLRFPVH